MSPKIVSCGHASSLKLRGLCGDCLDVKLGRLAEAEALLKRFMEWGDQPAPKEAWGTIYLDTRDFLKKGTT